MNIHRPITGLIESKWQPQELVILKKKPEIEACDCHLHWFVMSQWYNSCSWLALDWLSGCSLVAKSSALVSHVPVVEQWTLVGFELVEWLFIGSQVILVGLSCPSGRAVDLRWLSIG